MSGSVHRCPVCNGTGVMPKYVAVARKNVIHPETTPACTSCFGRGVIIVQGPVDAVSTTHVAPLTVGAQPKDGKGWFQCPDDLPDPT